jgi:hypothetical protein
MHFGRSEAEVKQKGTESVDMQCVQNAGPWPWRMVLSGDLFVFTHCINGIMKQLRNDCATTKVT